MMEHFVFPKNEKFSHCLESGLKFQKHLRSSVPSTTEETVTQLRGNIKGSIQLV